MIAIRVEKNTKVKRGARAESEHSFATERKRLSEDERDIGPATAPRRRRFKSQRRADEANEQKCQEKRRSDGNA